MQVHHLRDRVKKLCDEVEQAVQHDTRHILNRTTSSIILPFPGRCRQYHALSLNQNHLWSSKEQVSRANSFRSPDKLDSLEILAPLQCPDCMIPRVVVSWAQECHSRLQQLLAGCEEARALREHARRVSVFERLPHTSFSCAPSTGHGRVRVSMSKLCRFGRGRKSSNSRKCP